MDRGRPVDTAVGTGPPQLAPVRRVERPDQPVLAAREHRAARREHRRGVVAVAAEPDPPPRLHRARRRRRHPVRHRHVRQLQRLRPGLGGLLGVLAQHLARPARQRGQRAAAPLGVARLAGGRVRAVLRRGRDDPLRGDPLARPLVRAVRDQAGQLGGQPGEGGPPGRVPGDHVVGPELRMAAGGGERDRHPERVDVGGVREGRAADRLLRRHVAGRPLAAAGERRRPAQLLRDAEVDELRPRRVHDDVARLDVPVDDRQVAQGQQRRRQPHRHPAHRAHGQRPSRATSSCSVGAFR